MNTTKVSGFTLLHKALALVVVPFLFNCIWLIVLSNELNKSQHLAAMERQQSRFIESLGAVLKHSYQTRENFVGFIATNDKRYASRADRWIDRTEQALSQLRSLPDLAHDQLVLVRELEEIIVDQSKLIRDVLRDSKDDTKLGLLLDIEPVSKGVDSILNKYPGTEQHIAQQRKDLENARQDAIESSAQARQILILGLAGNLALTLLLVFFIVHGLAKRLNTLMENTMRLPQRQALNAPISGFDELAALDRSLHDTSAELAKAYEFRTEFMQMIAHDLRSPLTSCLVGIDLLHSAALADPDKQRFSAIRTSLSRVIELTNDLLLIEQFECAKLPLALEAENMHELVDQACSSVVGLAGVKSLKLENQVEVEYVMADRKRILQVLVNYLSNALKFSAPESSVTVTSVKTAECLKVMVRDSGPGVRLEDQDKLFERFFQAKEGKLVGGTGLGLAISKMIVEAHGGSVGIVSEPGRGAVFWFTIPTRAD